MKSQTILVTGCAGFIGFHIVRRLLDENYRVIGIDNINDYYDVSLKEARLKMIESHPNFSFYKFSLEDQHTLVSIFRKYPINAVIHLAAQAGVRYSLKNPQSYINSNIVGFFNLLEACRCFEIGNFMYASSSSVYGANTRMPFSVHHPVNHPVSLYAATKKSNELMAHTYSYLFSISTIGLRFFTVYGPWGRPDMALFLFTKAILEDKAIDVYNYGKMRRDFTYIDDIVESIVRLLKKKALSNPLWDANEPDPATSRAPYRIYNIGSGNPVELLTFITELENALGKKVKKNFIPLQQGDVPETYADVSDLVRDIAFNPKTPIKEGIANFVSWYKRYYGVK